MTSFIGITEEAAAVQLYKNGASLKRITQVLNCSRRRLRKILVSNGINIRSIGGQVKEFSKTDRHSLIQLLKNGFPCTDCGAVCGEFWGPESFEFDHLPQFEKLFEVNAASATKANATHEMILAEVFKCEFVCCNCHRARSRIRRINRASTKVN
jgi:hypothetical protein